MKSMLFFIQKWLYGDSFLNTLSSSKADLFADLAGQSIAIVGNARSLSTQNHGPAIDACDLVIRMHAAPLPKAQSHGSKTQWLALGMPVDQGIIDARSPKRLLWMAKKRKRLKYRFAKANGFYLHPKSDWDSMAEIVNAPPTTGVMLINLAAQSNASAIHLFGFDFFTSLSLSGSRTAAQVPHDFAAEKRFVTDLMQSDTRVVLHSQSH